MAQPTKNQQINYPFFIFSPPLLLYLVGYYRLPTFKDSQHGTLGMWSHQTTVNIISSLHLSIKSPRTRWIDVYVALFLASTKPSLFHAANIVSYYRQGWDHKMSIWIPTCFNSKFVYNLWCKFLPKFDDNVIGRIWRPEQIIWIPFHLGHIFNQKSFQIFTKKGLAGRLGKLRLALMREPKARTIKSISMHLCYTYFWLASLCM